MTPLKINSLNCRGLMDWHKRQFLNDVFRVKQFDICFFYKKLTVHLNLMDILGVNNGGGGQMFLVGSNRSKAVGISFRDGYIF